MDSKLKLLIDSLKLNNYEEYFTEGRLTSIIGSIDHKNYVFNIEVKSTLPINVYDELYSNLVSYYKDLHISLNVNVSIINTDIIKDYFNYFINRYSKKCPSVLMFLSDNIEFTSNILLLYVSSKVELDKFESIKDNLVKSFSSAGYNIELKGIIDIDASNEISKEIINSIEINSYVSKERMEKKDEVVENINPYKKKYTPKPIETVDDERAILGRIIDTTPVRLDTLTGVQNNVTVEANIFGIAPLSVVSNSMEPTFSENDLLLSKVTNDPWMNYEVGDIVTFQATIDDQEVFNTHRIVAIEERNGLKYYKTQGDNKETNPTPDKKLRKAEDIVAKWEGTKVPAIGGFFRFIRTQLGFFLCILLPMIIFFVYEAIRVILNIIAYNKEKAAEEAAAAVANSELTEEQKQRAIAEYLAQQNALKEEQSQDSDGEV